MTPTSDAEMQASGPEPGPEAKPKPKPRPIALLWRGTLALEAGGILLAIALFFDCATFAPSAAFEAWVPLFIALVLILLANVFLLWAWRLGGGMVRVLTALTWLPTLYIVADVIGRASLLFR